MQAGQPARTKLHAGGSVQCFFGDGYQGLPAHAPFDKIIVTAAASEIPNKLVEQLNLGGILIIPVGNENSQKMTRLRRTKLSGNEMEIEKFEDFKFVPMLRGVE